MSLTDEARALSRKSGLPCGVARLPAALRAELEEAIAAGITGASLMRALRLHHDIALSEEVITRHRRGDCSCR